MFLFLFAGFLVWLTGIKIEYIYVITILLLFSRIKFNKSFPNYLTIQKPDKQFSVRGFAVALKPKPFNGTFTRVGVLG
jgi:hypothetical protein